MNTSTVRRALALGLLLLPPPAVFAASLPSDLSYQQTTQRLVIKLAPDAQGRASAMSSAMGGSRVQAMVVQTGIPFQHLRHSATGLDVFVLPHRYSLAEAEALARQLEAMDGVEFAEPVYRRVAQKLPTDPKFYLYQWDLHDKALVPGSANLPGAWDITEGDNGLVMAVIDSGILPHPDLAGRSFAVAGENYPYGYDFISARSVPDEDPVAFFTANDGNGRDPDPSDPGDGIDPADATADCPASPSSWHGTFVAGILAATHNNDTGIAGVNWQSRLLPVRVLGRCGGFTDDIADAIIWAAGGTVDGVPNQHPARVINLSLGNPGACSRIEQLAIDQARALGAVVLAAAGNEGHDVVDAPANCNGVIAVTASDQTADLADFSNHGPKADIAAPGDPIYATTNLGETPGNYRYEWESGTSMSTPIAAGVASLMLSANRTLTGNWLAPSIVDAKLLASARAFTMTSSCNDSGVCGRGIIDAAAAVAAVSTPPTVAAGPAQSAPPGATISLSGSASDDGDSLAYQWQQIDATPYPVSLSQASTATAGLSVPSAPAGSVLEFQLTVTDDVGLSNSATTQLSVTNGPPLLGPIGDRRLIVNRRNTFTVSAVDPDGYSLSAANLPVGASFNPATGVFDWTPTATGSHAVSFTATDHSAAGLSSTETVTLTVTAAPPPSSGGGGAFGVLLLGLGVLLRKRKLSSGEKEY